MKDNDYLPRLNAKPNNLDKALSRSHLGQYQNARLEGSALPPDIVKLLTRYQSKFRQAIKRGQGFVFWGSGSSGKTYAAAAIARHAVSQGYSTLFISADELVRAHRKLDTMFDENETVAERARNVHLLIIDSLGEEMRSKSSDFAENTLYNIMSYRAAHKNAATIVTTKASLLKLNAHTPPEITQVYGERLTSLLSEIGLIIKFTGEDYRKTIQDDMKRFLECDEEG